MFRENVAYRIELVRSSVSKDSCDVAIYQEVHVRKKGPVDTLVRKLSFFRHDDRQILKLGCRGKLPVDVYRKCHELATWAMQPQGPLIDELTRRKSGEITDELVAEISINLMTWHRVTENELEFDKLRGQVTTYLRSRDLPHGASVTPGLINAVHDYTSLTLDGDLTREQMRKEEQSVAA